MMNLLKGKKIIIVDQSADFRATLKRVLTSHGCLVTEASSSHAALRTLAIYKPDLVIIDLMMPEKSAVALILEIKKKNCSGRVV